MYRLGYTCSFSVSEVKMNMNDLYNNLLIHVHVHVHVYTPTYTCTCI